MTAPAPAEDAATDLAAVLRRLEIDAVADGARLLLGKDAVAVVSRSRPEHVHVVDLVAREAIGMLVADRITRAGRDVLAAAGWSYWDRSGRLRLWRPPQLLVDLQLQSSGQSHEPTGKGRGDPLHSDMAREIALDLLERPETSAVGVRDLARSIGRDPGAVSRSLARMRDAALIGEHNEAAVPSILFWELAAAWPRRRPVGLAARPDWDDRQLRRQLRLSDWIESGDTAASAWGCPVFGTAPPLFYVPDEATLRAAADTLEASPAPRASTGCFVCPLPVRTITAVDVDRPWKRATQAVCALEVADRGRGAEAVRMWDPDPQFGVRRVW